MPYDTLAFVFYAYYQFMLLCLKDTSGTVDKIAKFLGKKITTEQKQQIVEHCSFQRMKSNPKTNYSWLEELGITSPKEGDVLRKGKIENMSTDVILIFLDQLLNLWYS